MSLDTAKPLEIDGSPFSFGIVAARYNPELVDALIAQVRAQLVAAGTKPEKIEVRRVPGSHELPTGVQLLLRSGEYDAVVALGVVIRGGTIHYELVSEAATQGLLRVALDSGVPVIAGVVATETREQAVERCSGPIDRGAEFARAALEMAALKKELTR